MPSAPSASDPPAPTRTPRSRPRPAPPQSGQRNSASSAAPGPHALRRTVVLVTSTVLFIILFLTTVAAGSVAIPLDEVVSILGGAAPTQHAWDTIVWDVRLPRAVTAAAAGAALGVAGLQMQTLFRNPLADPFVLGISSGASLGVALVVLGVGGVGATLTTGLAVSGAVGITGAAAAGAGLVTLSVLALSRKVANPATILILGVMAGYVMSSAVTVLMHADLIGGDRVSAYIAWSFGSFAGTSWSDLWVLVPTVLGALLLATVTAKPMDALLLGERYAASMGLPVRRTRLTVALGASVLAGAVTAFCGPIGFLGIAVPHLARGLLQGSAHRLLIPTCALMGATVALAAGLLSQLPGSDATLPLNAVTALVGAPVVIFVLLRMRRSAQAVTT